MSLSLLLTSKIPNEAVKQRSSEMQRALWHFGTIQCVYRNRTPPSRDGSSVITKEPFLRYSKVNVCNSFMQELQLIPHNTPERKFLNNCEAYKSFVKQSGRMLTQKDEASLYLWFRTNMTRYTTYEDNRRYYFKELLKVLQEQLGSI